jgi:hypothetical protein
MDLENENDVVEEEGRKEICRDGSTGRGGRRG